MKLLKKAYVPTEHLGKQGVIVLIPTLSAAQPFLNGVASTQTMGAVDLTVVNFTQLCALGVTTSCNVLIRTVHTSYMPRSVREKLGKSKAIEVVIPTSTCMTSITTIKGTDTRAETAHFSKLESFSRGVFIRFKEEKSWTKTSSRTTTSRSSCKGWSSKQCR